MGLWVADEFGGRRASTLMIDGRVRAVVVLQDDGLWYGYEPWSKPGPSREGDERGWVAIYSKTQRGDRRRRNGSRRLSWATVEKARRYVGGLFIS